MKNFEKLIEDIENKLKNAIECDANPEFLHELKKRIDELIEKMGENKTKKKRKVHLKTKLPAIIDDRPSDKVYRAILHKTVRSGDMWVLSVIDDKGYRTPGSWRIDSFFNHTSDMIYIDLGEKWGITNIQELIKEALTHV